MGNKHLIIGDAHAKPDTDLSRFTWLGRLIIDEKPDIIIEMGDFEDMPSLSSYDMGKKSYEGRRYKRDLEAAWEARTLINASTLEYNNRAEANKKRRYQPKKIALGGNHFEKRVKRAIELSPMLEGTISVKDNRAEEFGWEYIPFLEPITIDGFTYCLEASHKVLTKDLKYIPLRGLKVGDELIGFDEELIGTHRKYKTSIVEKHGLDIRELFEVTLDNGKIFRVTEDHKWLVKVDNKYVWRSTLELKESSKGYIKPSRIVKFFPEWEEEFSKEAGWLAGFFDGEGCISKPNTKQGGIQLTVSQNPGITFDKALRLIRKNFPIVTINDKHGSKCKQIRLGASSADKLKFLGRYRPERLINNFKPEMLGRLQQPNNWGETFVVSVKPIGPGEICKIQTSTKTMFVEGYAHHNCHYFQGNGTSNPIAMGKYPAQTILREKHTSCIMGHNHILDIASDVNGREERIWGISAGCYFDHWEDYAGRNNKRWWRGLLILDDVKDGTFGQHRILSMDYIKRKYGNPSGS